MPSIWIINKIFINLRLLKKEIFLSIVYILLKSTIQLFIMMKNKYTLVLLLILILIVIGIILKILLPKKENIEDKIIQNINLNLEDTTNRINEVNISYEIKNIKAITSENKYLAPVWSPDGKSILVTEVGYKGLYLINVSDNSIRKLNDIQGAGYNAVWSPDSKQIYFRNKKENPDYSSRLEVNSIDVMSGKISVHPEINPDGLLSYFMAKDASNPIVYTNIKTLLIEAQTFDKSKTWIVSQDPGQYYKPILSPDKTKVVLHKGGQMFVYAINGDSLISPLGNGIACSWSSDSKIILYFLSEDDGYQVTGSDLYLISSDGLSKWKLTNTPVVFEMFPCLSPDNKKIAFSDDKSGKVFIANLIVQ